MDDSHGNGRASMGSTAQSGSPPAEEGWNVLYPRLWKQAFGFLADAANAEDLAQETIMKFIHATSTGACIARPEAWCRRVLANLCRDHLRREKRRWEAREALERNARGAAKPVPLTTLEQSELRQRLADSLARLSLREREVFVLKDLEELSTADVAEALGLRESSVRALLSQARKRLRGLLGSPEEGERT